MFVSFFQNVDPLTPSYTRGLTSYHRRNTILQSHSSYIVDVSFTIPPTILTGRYNVTIRTDYRNQVFELDQKENNLRWLIITIQERYSNLVITDTSHSVEPTIDGNLLTYTYSVENQGGGPTIGAPWYDHLSISPTLSDDRDQMTLEVFSYGSNLPVQGTYQNTIVRYLPQNTHGTLFLRLSVDDRLQVIEESEADNIVRSGGISVLPRYADLEVQELTITTGGSLLGGQDITLEWSVINQGEISVQESFWYDAVSLSPTQSLDGNDIKLVDVVVSNGADFLLAPQNTYLERATVGIPSELDYSLNFYIILQVNSRNHIRENARLNNNLRVINIPLLPPPSPDLSVILVNYTYFPPTRILTVRWEVQNEGNSMTSAMSWRDQVFISVVPTFSLASSFVVGHRDQGRSMHANQVYTERGSFFVSSGLSGRFYVYVYTDSSNSVRETDGEDNNVLRSVNFVSIAQQPSVTLNISIDFNSLPSDYLTGLNFRIQYTVLNFGQVAVGTSSWLDRIYLSGIANPSRSYLLNDAFPLAQILNTMALNQGESYSVGINVTLPPNVLGRQYLAILLDSNNGLDARIEGTSGVVITIEQGPLPDLIVNIISMDLNITSGQPASIEYSISNTGEASANGLWYEALILSTDAEIDPFDPRLITVRNPPIGTLGVNESYNQNVEVFIPYDLPTLFYYMFIIVDTRDDIGEELNENNMGSFVLFITETVSTDIVITSVEVSPTDLTYGETLTFRYTLRNNGSQQATGYKCDSIYMSYDESWDISDFEIGVPQCGSVTLNGFHNNIMNDRNYNRAAMVPFIANGGYYGVVRTRTNIRDPDLSNNIESTSGFIQINAPVLVLGQLTTITIGPGEIRLYQIPEVPGSETLIASVATEQLNTYHDLYLRYKDAPTGAEHDAFSQFALSPDQRAVVRHTIAGTYYIRLESFTNTETTANYSVDILVRLARFEIHSVSPISAAPLGNVTIKITGTVISYFSKALLLDSFREPILDPSRMYWFNSETVYATFDTRGLQVGRYSVRLIDEKTGSIAQLNESFSIAMGVQGRLGISIHPPRRLRVGETGEIMVRLENIGNTDLLAPHLTLVSGDNTQFRLVDSSGPIDFATQLDFLGLPLEGPAGILPPGEQTQVIFRAAQTVAGTNNARFSIRLQSNSSAPHPYLHMKSDLKPEAIPTEVWDKIWLNFIRSVGTTYGSLLERLSEVASEFSLVSKKVYSIQELILYQLRVSYGLLSGKSRTRTGSTA